jgi:hypothetical protein
MLHLLQTALSILNLLATWRFTLSILVGAGTASIASRFIDDGRVIGWSTYILIGLGAIIGWVWESRHEKRNP